MTPDEAAVPRSSFGSSSGPAVDRLGVPVIDPTKNVLDLVEAAVKRLDDIHAIEQSYLAERLTNALQREDDLRSAESSHIRELLHLRSHYTELLSQKEADRLNAIRVVDVNAVTEASRVAAAQAITLATQVATSAETLRTQVATVATATATALANALEPLQKAIEDLRKTQYAQQGEKSAAAESRVDTRGDRQIGMQTISLLIALVGLGLAFVIYATAHR